MQAWAPPRQRHNGARSRSRWRLRRWQENGAGHTYPRARRHAGALLAGARWRRLRCFRTGVRQLAWRNVPPRARSSDDPGRDGRGQEVLARASYPRACPRRRSCAWTARRCPVIAGGELFGHERDAFAGRPGETGPAGAPRRAARSLDEMGELPLRRCSEGCG